MKIREVVEKSLRRSKSGISADKCAKVILSSQVKDGVPFQVVELDDVEHLYFMMKDACFPHVYGEASVFYFSAYYFHDEKHPVGRNYFIRKTDLLEIARLHAFFEERGIKLPMIPHTQLEEKARLGGFEKRIADFNHRRDKEMAHFKGLVDGRLKSTNVEQSMFLNTPGCLVCGDKDYLLMSSTFSATKGFMLGFNLCKKHMDIAYNENSLIEYLAKLCEQPCPMQFSPLEADEHVEMVLDWLPGALNSSVEKINKNTITLRRPSGLKSIFRLDSPTNYAYMIFDQNDEEIARIDSADHHGVNYGPDHIHLDLTHKKCGVESSFTIGSPLVDIKMILETIEIKEAELGLTKR